MKLSAFILSVNIAATIPIAMQCAAQASEEANSNNAYVPKNSIKSPDAQPKTSRITAARRKFSVAPQIAAAPPAANVISVNGVHLRPFVAGRKLPHRGDGQQSLMAQQPAMAQEQSSSLSARISENYNASSLQNGIAPYAQPNYTSNTPYMTSSPRMMLNEIQSVARQTKQSLKRRTAPQRQSSPPPEPVQPQMANGDPGQNGNEASADWMANEQNLNVVAPPAAPGQESIAAQMAQQQPMENVGTAGPPPFPLNLLPQQSLKQLMGSRPPAGGGAGAGVAAAPSRKIAPGPPSFFGSWHGNNNVIARNVAPTAGLPPAGFQSHMRSKGFGGAHIAVKHSPSSMSKQSRTLIAQARRGPTIPALKVSIYPPYNTAYSPAY
jgi:hypothetical protein